MVPQSKTKDRLHGITLEMILEQLVQQYGWAELAKRIPIRCFYNEPSIEYDHTFYVDLLTNKNVCANIQA